MKRLNHANLHQLLLAALWEEGLRSKHIHTGHWLNPPF